MWLSTLMAGTLAFVSCSHEADPAAGNKLLLAPTASPVPAEAFAGARDALKAAGVPILRWGLIPYVAPDEIIARYSPIIERVAERIGVPIEIVVGKSYEDLEGLIVRGEVDVAVLGPYAYVRARKRSHQMQVFASHVALGSTTYGTYILTHEDSGVRQLQDLVGKRVAFVDRRSTSGWLSPAAHLLEQGINPTTDLNAVFLGSHERVFSAVARGEVAAGAVYGAILSEGRKSNSEGGQVIVLAKCARIPYDAYVIRSGMKAVVGEALAIALGEISTRDRRGRRTLASLARINGFIPVGDEHYDTIRRLEDRIVQALGPAAVDPLAEQPAPSPAADDLLVDQQPPVVSTKGQD